MVLVMLYIVGLIVPCSVLGTKLTISPREIIVEGELRTLHMNGSCSPLGNVTACDSIAIGRLKSTGIAILIEIASGVNNDEPTIKDGSLRSRLSVSGDLTGTPPYLQFSLRDPTVADAGIFFCEAPCDQASISTDDPTSISTGDPTRISTGDPTRISTGDPTRISTGDPTRISTGDPTRISTGDPTSISTGDPTITRTDDPTIISTDDTPVPGSTEDTVTSIVTHGSSASSISSLPCSLTIVLLMLGYV